jgi:hypothetical protein
MFTSIRAQTIQDTIYSSADLDGDIRYMYYYDLYIYGTTGIHLMVGDSYFYWPNESFVARAYLSFDISSTPISISEYVLSEVKLFINQLLSVGNGTDGFPIFFDRPAGSVPCVLDHIIYGDSLDTTDYTAGDPGDPNTLTSNIGIISVTPDTGWRSLEVTDYFLEDLTAGRTKSQYRIRFTIDHDDDDVPDALIFRSANHSTLKPYLLLIYTDSTLSTNKIQEEIPTQVILRQNFPNPFNTVTEISYQLNQSSFVNLSIYAINGRLVKALVNEYQNMGNYSLKWDARNVSTGLYFYRISAGGQTALKKCVVLK